MKKILITGGTSKVAGALLKILPQELDCEISVQTSQSTGIQRIQSENTNIHPIVLSLSNTKELKQLVQKLLPDIIINAAGATNVDECETSNAMAWEANVKIVENLVSVCRIHGAKLIHFSTDYIFDGKEGPYHENSKPNPISYYGKSKLAGENAIVGGQIDYAILRTNVVFGTLNPAQQDFVTWVIEKSKTNKLLKIVDDQYSNPTFIDDLGVVVSKVIDKNTMGVINTGGRNWLNRFEFTKKISEVLELGLSVEPMKTEDLGQPAKRPLKGGLIIQNTESVLNMSFATVENALWAIKGRRKELLK